METLKGLVMAALKQMGIHWASKWDEMMALAMDVLTQMDLLKVDQRDLDLLKVEQIMLVHLKVEQTAWALLKVDRRSLDLLKD